MSVAGNVAGAFEVGAATGTFSRINTLGLTGIKTGLKVSKALGALGMALGGAVAIHEIASGKDNTHTLLDIGVTVVSGVAIGVVGTAALPVVAAVGLGYGLWSFAGGSDWIDGNYGYRDIKTGKLK